MSNITVVILTKNEEEHIISVIKNAQKLTDKVLIVDSGSMDKTVELAEKYEAEVVYREWDNDFSAQRNFALKHVETEWVLYLDADERMSEELINNIKKELRKNEDYQYSFYREIHSFGFKYSYGIFKPDEVIRIFKTNSVVWKNKVHEHPECKSKKRVLSGMVVHYTYKNWQHWLDKAGSYTTIWAEDNFANGKRTTPASAFMHAFYGLVRAYFLQFGFLDGWAGIFSSLQHFFYTLIKYLKLYELQKRI